MENDNIFIETINSLLQKTIENKIPWTLVNANALRWTKQAAPGNAIIVTLQKQPNPVPTNTNFVLTIQAQGTSAQVTQLNSATNTSLKEPLNSLYQEAIKVANSVSIRMLKNLLDGL